MFSPTFHRDLGKAYRLPKAADPTMKILRDVSLEGSGLNTVKMRVSNQTISLL